MAEGRVIPIDLPETTGRVIPIDITPTNSKVEPNESPKELVPGLQATSNMLKEAIQAGATGALAFGTTLLKAANKAGTYVGLPDKRRDIQNFYEEQYAITERNKITNPMVAPAQTLGSLLTPIPGAGAAANIAAKLGAKAIGNAGKVLGPVVQGAIYGGAYTQPGQGEDIINMSGAQTGAMLGPLLSGASAVASRYGNKAINYGKALDSVTLPNGYRFKGSVFSRDLEIPGASFWGDFKREKATQILDNLPFVGTAGARYSQIKQAKPYIVEWIKHLSDNTVNASKQAIFKNVDASINLLKSERHKLWSSVWPAATKEGVSTTPLNVSANNLKNILTKYSNELTTGEQKILSNALSGNKSPSEVHKLRQDVWTIISRLDDKINTTTEQDDLIHILKQTYGTITDDIKNSLGKTKAVNLFEEANTFEQGFQELLNKKTQRHLVNAIDDLNKKQRGLEAFSRFMLNPKTTERDIQEGVGIVGEKGRRELQAIIMNDLLKKSMNSSGLINFDTLVKETNKLAESPQKILASESLDVLNGLIKYVAQPNILAKQEMKLGTVGSGMAQWLGAGAAVAPIAGVAYSGAGVLPAAIGTAAVLSTPIALSSFSRYSPLKRSLSWFNKIADKDPTNLSTVGRYLIQEINKNLVKAGIVIERQSSGEMLLKDKEE